MPQYEYVCLDCKNNFTTILTLSEHDKETVTCPKCGSKKVEQKVMAFFAVTGKKS